MAAFAHLALRRQPRRGMARGALLLGLLIAIALGGMTTLVALDVWAMTRQRELEQELLFVGEQYRAAIERYYHAAPKGAPRVFPASLKDLAEDDRYPIPMRHLRRLYPDPLTGAPQWGAVLQGTRITGVFSLGKGVPLKQAGFAKAAKNFEGKSSYREWAFVFVPPAAMPVGRAVRPTPGESAGPPVTSP
jgi:type II secretory pathway pseudopilin PulG